MTSEVARLKQRIAGIQSAYNREFAARRELEDQYEKLQYEYNKLAQLKVGRVIDAVRLYESTHKT